MDMFEDTEEFYSADLKKKAGFGKGGEKNFDGVAAELQMQTYLLVKDFRLRKRKSDGQEYGWPISVYTTPEQLWGYEHVTSGYQEDPKVSWLRLQERIQEEYPWADARQIGRVLR